MAVYSITDKRTRRVCCECNRHGMSEFRGDIVGQSRWLCSDCKRKMSNDFYAKRGRHLTERDFRDLLYH
jgi:transposase-like protein